MPDPVLSRRGRLNALRRHHGDAHPSVYEADRDLRAESLAQHAARIVADWPPLTDDQVDRVVGILRGAGGGEN